MLKNNESELHQGLVEDLLIWLRDEKGLTITAADIEGYEEPGIVENPNGYGDGENKQPDIDASDKENDVYVRGEAKTGDGDIESEHSKTQYRLFANRVNEANRKPSLLYIIVPKSKISELEEVLEDLGLLDKPNVITVRSGKY